MKRALVVLLLVVISAGCQTDGASSPEGGQANRTSRGGGGGDDDATARAGLEETIKRYTDALLKKDMAALDRIWADDLVFVNPRGQVQTKAQRMADIKSGATAFKSIDLQDVTIKTCGRDAALHLSRGKIDAQYSGKPGSGEFRISVALCRHDGGQWRIHAIHMTPTTAGQ